MVRAFLGLVSAIVVSPTLLNAEWTPPEKPDPQVILSEAREDTRAKRYEIAFEKLVWFDENAVAINPAMVGVKNSFALGQLVDLAEHHLPAAKRVEELRATAVESIREGGPRSVMEFIRVVMIDQRRGETAETLELFELVADESPNLAHAAYGVVEPIILKAERFDLVAKYLDPKAQFRQAQMAFEAQMRSAKLNRRVASANKFAVDFFRRKVSTVIALLVKTDQDDEAERYYQKAVDYWDEAVEDYEVDAKALDKALDAALDGRIPKPLY